MFHKQLIKEHHLFLFIAFLLSCGLAFAFYVQYYLGIEPCDMCYTQRYLFAASISFCFIAAFFSRIFVFLKYLSLIALMINFSYSSYHVGVEQKWWRGPESCTSHGEKLDLNVQSGIDPIEMLKKHLDQKKVVLCDKVSWRILGIPATVCNTLFLLCLVIFHMGIIIRWKRKTYL